MSPVPKQYSEGGRTAPPPPVRAGRTVDGRAPRSLRQRFSALANLRPFLRMIWEIHPGIALATVLLRLLRALLPVATLYVGKLIIDEVVRLAQLPGAPRELCATGSRAASLRPLLGLARPRARPRRRSPTSRPPRSRCSSRLLAERFTNTASVRLMEHAATLDLEDFEDSEIQDQLERARRQATGRIGLLCQLFGQAQDVVTIVAFAAGLVVYAPWLIAAPGSSRWCRPSSARRTSTRTGYSLACAADAERARARLPALRRRERRDREGGEDLRPRRAS